MSRPMIHDGETHREMTESEYADWRALCAEIDAQKQLAAAATTAAVSARAKLAALGLTDAEIAALVG